MAEDRVKEIRGRYNRSIRMGKVLDENLEVKCGWCMGIHSIKEWNDLTYSYCTRREMRRLYTPLTNIKAFSKNNEVYYCCPTCSKWSRGNQLRVMGDEYKGIGGEPVMMYTSKDN